MLKIFFIYKNLIKKKKYFYKLSTFAHLRKKNFFLRKNILFYFFINFNIVLSFMYEKILIFLIEKVIKI
jgi:hypothetical protein